MWKNDRFFEERGKAFTPKIAAALLKDGKAKVKGLRSMKTGTYDIAVREKYRFFSYGDACPGAPYPAGCSQSPAGK